MTVSKRVKCIPIHNTHGVTDPTIFTVTGKDYRDLVKEMDKLCREFVEKSNGSVKFEYETEF